ncbi:hypothetical protein SteCoe_27142 [Stentor coeruleus]|uniref:t-SNARE coiled-coil homology domain-containing protein n=1 Tax=Stentor coeruleus TaxID=5963 RepID=A0A1R2BBH5_9CILI|nr:hypothetical protein SteCoe_27142 [Stentor coeruleus]
MVELVKGYEQEFLRHFSSNNKKISSYESSVKQESLLIDIKHGIVQAENSLKNMEREILGLDPQQAALFGPRVKRYQENLMAMKKTVKDIDYRKNKVDLLGAKREETREKLLDSTEVLQDSGEALERINKIGKETEDIGYESLGGLKKQRVTIQNIHDKVKDVDGNVSMANRTITEMNSRRLWMKFMMYGIIFLLIGAIAILLYIKLL